MPESTSEAVDEVEGGEEREPPLDENLKILNSLQALGYGLQRRLVLLQRLKSYEGKAESGQERLKVCEELGISRLCSKSVERGD
jgi:hypothetical protein